MSTKIAILGDFNRAYATHHALNKTTQDVQAVLPEVVQFDWIGTDVFKPVQIFEHEGYKGLWIAPGSPYKNDENVLKAIAYTRMNNIPTLGNCGGFQYMLIEFAKNVCGVIAANHEETNPDGPELLINKLSCSLVGQEEELAITDKASLLYRIIRKDEIIGRYFCNYGLNDEYREILQHYGLAYTALSPEKEVRAFELKTHPFFLGTLFQPALTSTEDAPDPIIISFIQHSIKIFNTLNT